MGNVSFELTQLCLYTVRSNQRRKVINSKYKSKGTMIGTEREWLLGKVILTKKA